MTTSYMGEDCQENEERPIEVCGLPCLKIETWHPSFMAGQMWATRRTTAMAAESLERITAKAWRGGWPRSQKGFYQVEGAPGPSPLGTGEGESNRRSRIHSGSCQPLSRAVHSDSISMVPCMPV